MLPNLISAGRVALSNDPQRDPRNFVLGCIGVRRDGVLVSGKNGAVISSTYDEYRIISDAHAETRVLKKAGRGAILYVARVLKKDGSFAMSRPCQGCQLRVKAAGVLKVYYTIDPNHYGIYYPSTGFDRIIEC